jgi:hypothetical protein
VAQAPQAPPQAPQAPAPQAPAQPQVQATDSSARTTAVDTKPKAKSLKKGAKGGFELYIDCQPIVGGKPIMTFEAWIYPHLQKLGEILESQGKDANVMRLDFGEQKAAIADVVTAALDDVPSGLLVTSSNPIAKDALNVLIPHAARVVRAVR